jgi:hypothetical protein
VTLFFFVPDVGTTLRHVRVPSMLVAVSLATPRRSDNREENGGAALERMRPI